MDCCFLKVSFCPVYLFLFIVLCSPITIQIEVITTWLSYKTLFGVCTLSPAFGILEPHGNLSMYIYSGQLCILLCKSIPVQWSVLACVFRDLLMHSKASICFFGKNWPNALGKGRSHNLNAR